MIFYNLADEKNIEFIDRIYPYDFNVNSFDIGMFAICVINKSLKVIFTDRYFGLRVININENKEVTFDNISLSQSNFTNLKTNSKWLGIALINNTATYANIILTTE